MDKAIIFFFFDIGMEKEVNKGVQYEGPHLNDLVSYNTLQTCISAQPVDRRSSQISHGQTVKGTIVKNFT